MNCDTVADSEWSVFLGLPNAVWGLFGYLVMVALCVWGMTRRTLSPSWPAGLLLLLSGFTVAVSAVLAYVSKVVIHSMCLMCMASWAIAVALLVVAVIFARRKGLLAAIGADLGALVAKPRLTAALAIGAALALATLWVSYPRYWILDGRVGPGALGSGRDEAGLYWMGSARPKLTVTLFSDYQCPHCARAHEQTRKLLEQYPDLRVVHRDYPLNEDCNPLVHHRMHRESCQRAAAAGCAGEQGKFWEMNDLLFLGQRRRVEPEVPRVPDRSGHPRAHGPRRRGSPARGHHGYADRGAG